MLWQGLRHTPISAQDVLAGGVRSPQPHCLFHVLYDEMGSRQVALLHSKVQCRPEETLVQLFEL